MDDVYEIIGKHLRGEASKDDERTFQKWLSTNEYNKQVFQEAKTIWNMSANLRADGDVNEDKAWEEFATKRKVAAKQVHRYVSKPIYWHLTVAASVLLVTAFSYLYFSVFSYDVRLETSMEILSEIELPDGSRVWLNKNSMLEFEENETFRNAQLMGQAYFEVYRNPEKPFIISTGALKTQVVGTSFDINYSNKEKIEVSVISGQVKVYKKANENQGMMLFKGLGVSYSSKSEELNLVRQLDQNFLAWKTGILKFVNTSIDEVIQTLEDHFQVQIVIDKPDDQARLTAEFNNLKLEEIIELIQLTTDVKLFIAENIN